jgi:hypothetical protein
VTDRENVLYIPGRRLSVSFSGTSSDLPVDGEGRIWKTECICKRLREFSAYDPLIWSEVGEILGSYILGSQPSTGLIPLIASPMEKLN